MRDFVREVVHDLWTVGPRWLGRGALVVMCVQVACICVEVVLLVYIAAR